MITDTQVLSYYFKGTMALPKEQILISSITAAEFLLVQGSTHNKANYYPILPIRLNHRGVPPGKDGHGTSVRAIVHSRRHAAFGKRRTDRLILDFGPGVPTYIEFGGTAITQIINDQQDKIYLASIIHLDKLTQKKLISRFSFLTDAGVSCVAVTPQIATVGLNLLGQFMDRYQSKDNKRNTVNDVLVLATAIKNEMSLITNDNLLTRFAAEVMIAPSSPEGDCLIVDFSSPTAADRRKPLESKGFINRGWQVLQRRTHGQ